MSGVAEDDTQDGNTHEADAHEASTREPDTHDDDGVESPEPASLSRRPTDPVDPHLERPPYANNEPDAIPGPSGTPAGIQGQGGGRFRPASQAVRLVSPQEFRGYPKVSYCIPISSFNQ